MVGKPHIGALCYLGKPPFPAALFYCPAPKLPQLTQNWSQARASEQSGEVALGGHATPGPQTWTEVYQEGANPMLLHNRLAAWMAMTACHVAGGDVVGRILMPLVSLAADCCISKALLGYTSWSLAKGSEHCLAHRKAWLPSRAKTPEKSAGGAAKQECSMPGATPALQHSYLLAVHVDSHQRCRLKQAVAQGMDLNCIKAWGTAWAGVQRRGRLYRAGQRGQGPSLNN